MYNQINAIDLNGLVLFHELANSTAAAGRREAAGSHGHGERKLRDLEREIGAVLFKRGPRRMTLTDAGAALVRAQERIVAEVARPTTRFRRCRPSRAARSA